MYTKGWTAATFLLTRIYLCVNNGHNNNFNPVFIILRYIWITFINIIHYKCIVLLKIFHPVSKWERVVVFRGGEFNRPCRPDHQLPFPCLLVPGRPKSQRWSIVCNSKCCSNTYQVHTKQPMQCINHSVVWSDLFIYAHIT